jgi:hypothetical protein
MSAAASGGSSQPAAAAVSPAPVVQAPTPAQVSAVQPVQPVAGKSGGGAVKIILIVVAILVFFAILVAGVVGYLAYKAKKAIQVTGDGTTVTTPWGNISASDSDGAKIAQDLGVEVYPGAKALEGASMASFGNVSFGGAEFETSDPIDKVEAFYKSRFPKSTMSASTETDRTLMVVTDKGWVTVVLEPTDNGTKIRIAKTTATGESPEPEASGSDSE